MNSLSLILAPMLMLQGVGQAPLAIENDAPETWTLEYPRLIQPFVEDYRRCLAGQMRRVTGEADFELQHRSDLPSCEQVSVEAQAAATAALVAREGYSDYTADDVREIFEHAGRIHIARGADLDQQFTFVFQRSEAAREEYDGNKPEGLVLELFDASVVKARTDSTAEAAIRAREEDVAAQDVAAQGEARGAND